MQTVSANRTLREQPRQTARCKGSKGQQATLRSAGNVANGFLSHRFLPLCEPSPNTPEAGKGEGGFFKSLSHMAGHYGFEPMDTAQFAYPANILIAQLDAR